MRISDWSSDVCSSDLVASLAHAFADAALRDIASRELLALAIDDRCCPRQKAARIRGETAADPPNEAGKEGLHREATLATDHAAPHTRLAAERDKALNFALGIPPTGLGAGHLRELHVDLLRREIPARCAVDEASIDPCRQHLA